MISADDLTLAPIADLQLIHGVRFPKDVKFRQFLITGPPGAGKSTIVGKMRGWPYEAYVDLAVPNWWRMQALTFRPRELHLGTPFKGHREALTVVDDQWKRGRTQLRMDFGRIEIPPTKRWWLGLDWRKRYTFEFILPPAETIYYARLKRAKTGLFPHDEGISLDDVKAQIDFYRTIAWYFWLAGMNVYIRTEREGAPLKIMECKKPLALKPIDKPTLFDQVESAIRKARDREFIVPAAKPETITGVTRIAWSDQPFLMKLGNTDLEFHPDRPFDGEEGDDNREWIVHPGSSFFETVPRFIRIRPGQTITLGSSKAIQREIFGYDDSVEERQLKISNRKGALKIFPVALEQSSSISTLETPRALWVARHENLLRLRQVLGRPLTCFENNEALDILKNVNSILATERYRELNEDGAPGGIIKFPDDMKVVILGDTHTQIDNILRLLSEGGMLKALEAGEACLVFLGDLVHGEDDSEIEDMKTSMLALDLFCMLKQRFPEQVFYVRGNHESYSYNVGKGGVPQGLLLERYLLKQRGEAYVAEVEHLFENLAYIIQNNGFAACHGAPVRSHVDHNTLVNIKRYPGIQYEILWNRLRQNNRPAGYGKGSVKRFRKTLNLPKKAPMIVGHTPPTVTETVWMNVGGIKGHHVVYSAYTDRFGAMVISQGKATPLEFVPEPALAYLNNERDL